MATNDYIIDNAKGDVFRADLNLVLSAIVSNNSNPTEPTTTFAYMWWVDTTTCLLKQRNSSNTGWVDIFNLAGISVNDLSDGTTEGTFNIGLGLNALLNNTGTENVAVGSNALTNNIQGSGNVALGHQALLSNTSAINNTAIGASALLVNTLGLFNTALGKEAAKANTSGDDNVAIGYKAFQNNTMGNNNTALGVLALSDNILGNNNVAIGVNSGAVATNFDYTITLGANTVPLGTNYLTFGKNGGIDRVYNQFTANATWIRVSDERIKKEIETNEDCGLGFINDLRTVTYKFKAPSELDPSLSEYDPKNDKPSHDKPMYGFIAQEVKEVLGNHNIKNFSGWHVDENGKDKLQGISYEMFVMPLVKAVQELSKQNKTLEDKIDTLLTRVEALENLTR